MNATISVLFFARKSKSNSQGKAPIYMRITINGERYDLGTKRFVTLESWLPEAVRLKGSSETAKYINSFLDSLRAKAYDHQKQILLQGKQLTMEEFKTRWQGVSVERPRMLMEIFTQHNEQMKALVNHEFSPILISEFRMNLCIYPNLTEI